MFCNSLISQKKIRPSGEGKQRWSSPSTECPSIHPWLTLASMTLPLLLFASSISEISYSSRSTITWRLWPGANTTSSCFLLGNGRYASFMPWFDLNFFLFCGKKEGIDVYRWWTCQLTDITQRILLRSLGTIGAAEENKMEIVTLTRLLFVAGFRPTVNDVFFRKAWPRS